MYCKNCGEILGSNNDKCTKCGTNAEPEKCCYIKNPLFAAVLSLIVPGLGQIYNGQIRKGIFFIIITAVAIIEGFSLLGPTLPDPIVLIFMATLLIFYVLFWIFNISDAYKTTLKINYSENKS